MTAITARINTFLLLLTLLGILALIAMVAARVEGGPLNPPGPPASTDSVRLPGTPITSIPIQITQPGHYYFTRNLVATTDIISIDITVSDVSIDLMGFRLDGNNISPSGFSASPCCVDRISISNGFIVNHTNVAISLSANGVELSDLHVADNAQNGVSIIGDDVRMTDVELLNNGDEGVELAGNDNVLTRVVAVGNAGPGIEILGNRSIVDSCVATGNGGDGVRIPLARGDFVIENCLSTGNTGDGIEVYEVGIVRNNEASRNGAGGDGAGIHVIGGGVRVEGNNVVINDRGIDVDFFGNVVINNTARANTVNYDLVADTRAGAIVTDPSTAPPFANFSY